MPVSVFIGASQGGATAAATLREGGYDGRIVLIGAEPTAPYERPPLSKEYLRGEEPFENAYLRPDGWYEANGIEMRLGTRVDRLDTEAREVVLEGGERIAFDQAVVATGSRNKRPPIPGIDLEGVLSLRTAADADAIRSAAAPGARAVLVGMGFIGAEFEALRTKEGSTLEGDFAVVGVGVEPVTDVVDGTNVAVDNGILVDAALRTNVPGVYAVGDVARHDRPVFGPIRV